MHAIQLHVFGAADNLRFEEVGDPVPASGRVRITVKAAGVHLIDTAIRAGRQMGPMPLPDLPTIPGREIAGVVDALGPDVGPDWLGQRVVAHLGTASGGYAELVVTDTERLHRVPDALTDDIAVAMIGTGRTTLGILDIAQLVASDVVLVTAAAGGIGSLLVQAARSAGATVVGLAGGAAKVERVRQLGATFAIDYAQPDWPLAARSALAGREITLALDGVGGTAGRQALELLGSGGRLILFGWSSGAPTQFATRDLLANGLTVSVGIGPHILKQPGGLRRLEERALAAAANGSLMPMVSRFPLASAAAAHTALETRATLGKTVLIP
jgi:NADPH2:quinone reductase